MKDVTRHNGWQRSLMAIVALFSVSVTQPVLAQRGSSERVTTASGNKMQTDSLSTSTFDFWNKCDYLCGQVQLPVRGRAKIGENNSALPEDRFYFVYKHFENTLHTSITDGVGTVNRNLSLDRYNFGVEKTFGYGNWSAELRMPLFGNVDYFNSGFSSQLGGIGNLSVITKRLIYESDTTAWATGLGLSAPTGADSQIRVADELFTIKNEAVHFFPFVGFLTAPTERTFYQGFIQLDVPTNGNSLVGRNTITGSTPIDYGSVRDQALLYVDMSAGYWLYGNPSAPIITGLASAVELHYTTTLEDAHTLAGDTFACDGCTDFQFGNADNRFDVLNINVGFHTNWFNRFTAYTGIVAPLDDGTDRFFDMEAQMSLNFYY